MTVDSATKRLEKLAEDYWTALLARHPLFATTVAVHDHDRELDDPSADARDAWTARARELAVEVEAVPVADLSRARRVTRAMLLHELQSHVELADTRMDRWAVDQLGGPQVVLLDLARIHQVTSLPSMQSFLARVRDMGDYLDKHAEVIRASLECGEVAARCNVTRVIQQLDDVLAAGPDTCSLVTVTATKPESVPEPAWRVFRADLVEAVTDGLFPGLMRYRDFLRTDVLPASRQQPGLCALPNGAASYTAAIHAHVTLDLSAQELHDMGLREMERIRTEMKELLARLFPGSTMDEALKELRENPIHSFSSRQEIVDAATSAISRATAAATTVFAHLPDHECQVRPIDTHSEKSAPAAYYLGPAPDGTRPGTYYVNTHDPTSRPRHEAEVVAFHEAVPGHHLQIALAQTMVGVPEFQKHAHSTAYVEGWALYTERLANELGLYSGPADLLGMLSCDAWRASRLVVDTGLHAFGWSREQAIDYMNANTAASLGDVQNEVDRYIAWPGQALSYKTGQLEILRLRKAAEEALWGDFDLTEFHDVVLRDGGVTLPVLRDEVEHWLSGSDSDSDPDDESEDDPDSDDDSE